MTIVALLFRFGPLYFGIAFLAPVIAATLVSLGITAPFGLTPLAVGLMIGGLMGGIASLRRSWL